MYLTTERRATQVKYLYVILAIMLVWGVFLNAVGNPVGKLESLLLIFPISIIGFLIARGKFILEIDTDSEQLLISNRSALLNKSVPFFRNDLKIYKTQFRGFWIENHVVVRRLFIRYENSSGKEITSSYSLSAVNAEEIKAIKASLGRITVQNKRRYQSGLA